MRMQRPGAVTAAGIIAIIFGILGLFCGAVGLYSSLDLLSYKDKGKGGGLEAALKAELVTALEKKLPAFKLVEIGRPTLVLILAVLLLVAGIGLLNMQRWARVMAIIYSAVTIPMQIGYAIYFIGLALPAIEEVLHASTQLSSSAGTAGFFVGVLVCIGPAIVLLILLLLPNVSAAFASQGHRRRFKDDYDDEDYDDSRRRDDDDEEDEEDSWPRRRDRY